MFDGRFDNPHRERLADHQWPLVIVYGRAEHWPELIEPLLVSTWVSLQARSSIIIVPVPAPRFWSTHELRMSFADTVRLVVDYANKPSAIRSPTQRKEARKLGDGARFLCALPSVGPKTAKILTDYFGTPGNALASLDDWPLLPGIGDKTVATVRQILYG